MPKKLLVADDSLTIQKVIRLALSGAASGSTDGYEIQAVSDGNDAIQQISLFRPDVVLIDVSLPGKSAFEVKRATNQHRDLAHVRFVLMSSAFEKVDEAQVEEVTFHGRLTKPFDPAHLREVLSQVLSQAPAPLTSGDSESIVSENEPTLFLHNAPPLPPAFPSMSEMSGASFEPESDIRNLTESTIRMSGLAEMGNTQPPEFPPEPPTDTPDDFQWSVEEHSLKPSQLMDAGDSTFPLAPPPRIPNEHSRFLQRPTSEELQLTPPPPPEMPFDESAQTGAHLSEIPAPPEMPRFTAQAPEPAVDPAQFEKKIEEMIRSEVVKAILKAAQETLPDVVERVIKEEIHKLLQDSP